MTEFFVFKFYIFTWFKWSLFFRAVLGAQQYSQVALPPAPSTSPTRESTLTRRPRPRSVVYVGSHSRRCTVYECGPMYDDTYPPLHPEDFKCRVGGSCARSGAGVRRPRGPSWASHTFRTWTGPVLWGSRAELTGSCRLGRRRTTGIFPPGEGAAPPRRQGPAGTSEHAPRVPHCRIKGAFLLKNK